MRCPGPLNRILLMRKKNLCGPLFQNIGNGVCAKSVGAFWDANGPGGNALTTDEGEVLTTDLNEMLTAE